MKLFLTILRWGLVGIVLLLLLGGGGGYLWLRGALPQTEGTVKVQGIAGPVEIIRDSDAVPHIRASTEEDAMFGLGYVHAQDRLWQMEFQRRVGNGRLSEVLGPPTVEADKFLRTVGTGRAAERAWENASPQARRIIEAYVAGVNAFISTHSGRELPIEFTILGFAPEPWRPADILLWGKMMALNLGGNWPVELQRANLIAKLGEEQAAQLQPSYIPNGTLILPNGTDNAVLPGGQTATGSSVATLPPTTHIQGQYDQLLAINRFIEDSLGLGGRSIGSNNWVISGARSSTGKPLLANDPHLGTQLPAIWYLAHIQGGAIDAIGATLPGVPGVIIGHNKRIAWGVTNTAPDVQDLFIQRVNERNEVEYKGQWEPMQIIPEVIKVKGQPDVTIQVRMTRHGPLISDVLQGVSEPLALRWTALDDQDSTLDAFVQLNRAQNWEDFTNALRSYHVPMQSFVYADVDGNIGFYAPGALPIRANGDGTRPVPGWSGEYDWTGYVPFEQLPHTYNPPEGYIVSANNKVAPDSYPYLIASSWASPYRAMRIVELIEAKDKLTPDDIAAMQADVTSVLAQELLPYMLRVETDDPQSVAALALLKDWDGSMHGDSPQAAIYQAWFTQITRFIFADELGNLWDDYRFDVDVQSMIIPQLLAGEGGTWCDDVNTQPVEDCSVALAAALKDGLAEMARYQGTTDLNAWRWDKVHHAIFPHNPFGSVDPLRSIFNRSIPTEGDRFTVNVAPHRITDLYNHYHIPSYRQIIDLSNISSSRFIFAGGQSGHVLSDRYSNLIEPWQRVEYLPMRFDAATIDTAAAERLVLEP